MHTARGAARFGCAAHRLRGGFPQGVVERACAIVAIELGVR